MSSQFLDARYELLDEMPHVTGGRLFRARDVAFSEMVGVRQLGPGCGLGPEERRPLENLIRHLQCLPHPNLVRIYDFDPHTGLLVHEWVQGLSLLDLLRRRRELSAGETMRLLAALPAALDFLSCEAVPVPRPLLGKLFVQFAGSPPETAATTPIEQWPAFTLKLNPLSLRGHFASPSAEDKTLTVIVDPRHPTEISENYGPREFARLLYELLGGRIRELDARRYSPLSALRESGNAVLRRNLLAMPHNDCSALWHDLLATLPPPPTAATQKVSPFPVGPRTLHIPESLLPSVHPGAALRLDSADPTIAPVYLIARPRFAIGRSAQQADFLAKVLPENETNDALTNRLSRVHTLLEIIDGQVCIRDGNGNGPSLNGSFLDGTPLLPDPPAPLTHRAQLTLGAEYSLELISLQWTTPDDWQIGNLAAWSGPPEKPPGTLRGALVCQPINNQPTIRHVAWLFSEVGFGLDNTGRLVWDTRGRSDSPAAFHYHRGCFWLRNRALPETALTCHGTPLRADNIAPLRPGQTVHIGSHAFTIRIS
jgi:hypothetical protein